jgi:PilZ domain
VLDVGNSADTKGVIGQVRTGKRNRYSIVLALVDDGPGASAAWSAGANFTIRRSSCFREDLKKAFDSALGLILREKRRYHRHPIDLDSVVMCNGRMTVMRMVDISERGACLVCSLPLSTQQVHLEFSLPRHETASDN